MPCPAKGPANDIRHIGPEENQVVEPGGKQLRKNEGKNEGKESTAKTDDIPYFHKYIESGQPFCFDRENEVNPNILVGEEGGKGKKQSVMYSPQSEQDVQSEQKGDHAGNCGKQGANQVEHGESGRTPFPFHGGPEEIVKGQKDNKPDGVSIIGDKDKGD